MRHRPARIVAGTAVFVLALASLVNAADLRKATTDAEGRKRAAENGVRAIKSKAPQQADSAKELYLAAATAHGAWLDVTKTLVDKGESDSAASDAAGRAAAALVKWVAARNAALGEPVLAGKTAETIEASVRQGLIDISLETARRQRGANANKKSQAVSDLSNRLRWKDWNEL
jgi:hypothetical protein